MMQTEKPEILAPAGDMEKLRYAVEYGADAVYLAGKAFGMRAAAGNFEYDEMREGLRFAHEHHAKCYVTVNITPSNAQMECLPAYLEQLSALEPDAMLVSDVGVMTMAKKYAPNIPLHISTQTSILNYAAADFWAAQGAERIVLARELTLDEIAEIRARLPRSVEIECFVHGAMCISYSGRCLISQYLTGRDANQGACAQPCRWQYSLQEEKRPGEYFPVQETPEGTYLYNSKDLCMIDHIPELVRAGIDSFKIEGRAKTAYYAAGITGAYRRAVDTYFAEGQPESFVLPEEIAEEIGKVSHRHYYTGFFLGKEEQGQYYADSHYIRDWEITGMPVSCDAEGNVTFRLKNRVFVGDEVELMQPGKPPYLFRLEEMTDDEGTPLEVAHHPEMTVHIRLPFEAHPYAILRRPTTKEQ